GSCDLSLFEMMWGYTIFPGRGFSTRPVFISRIEDRNGNVIKRFDFSANHKEAVSEVTSYKMTKMMEGTVTLGTAGGLMQRLGAKEMGGKTGTTNDNADAWFIGFTPQLLAGVWIGCDDRFIRIESAQGYGGTAARPVWEAFFKKVYNNKQLGISRDAEFVKPADLQNESIDADLMRIIDTSIDMQDVNVTADDYTLDTSYEYMKPESQAPVNDDAPRNQKKEPSKKDTSKKAPKIGEMSQPQEKEKKGLFRKLFKKNEQPSNDY
ncbi:MAG TPA: penicillin-binding transpeptidase domain-containing protein, partial [Flavisolibacter sp.]